MDFKNKNSLLGYMEIIVEDKEADKYIAKEDVDKFLDQLRIFGEEYGQTWMMIPNGDGEADIALLQSQKSDPNQKRTLKIYTPDDMPELVKLFLHTK